jgi:hypothetical protein
MFGMRKRRNVNPWSYLDQLPFEELTRDEMYLRQFPLEERLIEGVFITPRPR